MSKLYNPELVSKEEIKKTFVGREKLLADINSIIRNQPSGAGVQHIILIAPRGMGKTTMLLMLRFGIEDTDLSETWQPIQFPEESYGIYNLADFWIKIADYLARDTNDEQLLYQIDNAKNSFADNDDLQEAVFNLIKQWRIKNNKQLLLLIDNFDMILEQINDEHETASLRKVLMNDDTVMIIGSAVTFFQQISSYEHPLYNFFKTYNLKGLKDEQIKEFLMLRAKEEGITNFEEIYRANTAKIRTLAYFTDGNPRLVLMLFEVINKSRFQDVEKALEDLLDEVTPYFKSKIELLPPQQRKILDFIAKMSFEKREGVTPKEISDEVRLSQNQTSSQLKRLAENSYIKAADIRGRSSFYVISEPLVAIWYQMRFGRMAYQKRRWLIFVLKALYELDEMRTEQEKLGLRFSECVSRGETSKAVDFLTHSLYLAEAMPEGSGAKKYYENYVTESLRLNNLDRLKEELKNPNLLRKLSPELLSDLLNRKLISKPQYDNANAFADTSKQSEAELAKAEQIMSELSLENRQKQIAKALEHFNNAIKLDENNISALFARSFFFYQFNKFRECLADNESLIKILENLVNKLGRTELANDLAKAYMNKGISLNNLGMLNEAIIEHDKAIQIRKDLVESGRSEIAIDLAKAYVNKGISLKNLHKLNEAIIEYDKAILILKELVDNGKTEFADDLASAYINKGLSLNNLDKLNEAIIEYDKSILILKSLVDSGKDELSNVLVKAYMNKGVSLNSLGKLNEAVFEFKKTIQILEPLAESGRNDLYYDLAKTYLCKGVSLESLGKLDESIIEYDRAITLLETAQEFNQNWLIPIDIARTNLNKMEAFIKLAEFERANISLVKVVNLLDNIGYEGFNSWILDIIFSTVKENDFANLRKLLKSEDLENKFFPILRAVDYLETKDKSLIEKLSPEVQGVVEEVVEKLREFAK